MLSATQFEAEVAERLPGVLAELLAEDGSVVEARHADGRPDLLVRCGKRIFVVEVKKDTSIANINRAIGLLVSYGAESGRRGAIPLIVVPFMPEAGKGLCRKVGQSWLDLSGNADIRAAGLRILIEGKPNRYQRRGRPSTAFAPAAARITRWLLMHPGQAFSQKELCERTDSDKGYASRVVGKLEADGLITLDGSRYSVRDPTLLLAAWQEDYDFSKHTILRGVVAARDGESAVRALTKKLEARSLEYAATGLAGAWFIDHFALFRVATLYLKQLPKDALLSELGVTKTDQGANVWFVVPNDEGVLHGAVEHDGVVCAHPVQVYLDLFFHPERAKEAAEHLRHTHWSELGLEKGGDG